MFDNIKHLLPRSRAFSIIVEKKIRKFWTAIGNVFEDAADFFELLWSDLFPQTTRHLTQWEAQFGLTAGTLTEQERRDRLDAIWAANGGQDPQYIRDTLQAAGFPVYVHEWWELPRTDPPTVRNPFTAINGYPYCCGSAETLCGDLRALCGNYDSGSGFGQALVNKIYVSRTRYVCCCGDPYVLMGEATHPLYTGNPSLCGANSGVLFERKEYPIPTDPTDWRYLYYVGGQTFGDPVNITSARRDEFEDLLLKISPSHVWIILFINFTTYIIEDASGEYVVEDLSNERLLEG